jgi:hypothetical protein
MKMNMRPYGWLRQLVVVAASLLALSFFAGLASAQQIIAINSGGPASSPFAADVDFSGGATIDHANTINTSKVTNPAPAAVYQSARIATTTTNGVTSFTYTVPGLTPGTNYLVRLHFCETFFTTTGSRVFNVSINGTQVLTNFDIVAASGGKNIANVQQFTEAANASGQFVIRFTSVTNNALISGIEINPVTTGPKLFAPYNDMSLTVSENIVTTAQNARLKAITLAFLVGNGSCSFGWGGLGGTLPTDNEPNGTTVQSLVHQMQANGVTVIISFGGANGAIVNGCTNASALQAGLQEVLTRYGVNMLDFDMEASDTLGDGPGLPVLDQALKGLKVANPNLVVSFTLPVLPTGLMSSGTAVLNQAHRDGLNPNVINVMAMDYGSSVDNGGQMGLDATQAAQAVHAQIQQAGLSSSVGITVMIGQNDTGGEIFQLSDVNTVLMFANSNSYVTRLSFWSLARDNGGCPGQKVASPTCSGIAQNTFQFSQSFEPF